MGYKLPVAVLCGRIGCVEREKGVAEVGGIAEG